MDLKISLKSVLVLFWFLKCFQIALNIKRCALKREVGSNPLHFRLCLCVSVDKRVFHQGAEEALPEEQRHGCLLRHLELCHDHGKSGHASPMLLVVSYQCRAQPAPSARLGSACPNHSIVSSTAPGFAVAAVGQRWQFLWQTGFLYTSCHWYCSQLTKLEIVLIKGFLLQLVKWVGRRPMRQEYA